MEEKLEILKDSHAGAFAILMGCCYFVLDYGVFHATDLRAIRLLAIGYVLSRAFSGLAIVVFKKARKSGLAATFSDSAQKKTVAVTMILYIAACAVLMVLTDAGHRKSLFSYCTAGIWMVPLYVLSEVRRYHR